MMTSGSMPMRPGLDAIYEALRRAIRNDPQLLERKAEEVSKELVRGGYLYDEARRRPGGGGVERRGGRGATSPTSGANARRSQ
jgi:hypothetical protein